MAERSFWVRTQTANGVPVWSTGAQQPARRVAMIVRAGIADETPETRGWLNASVGVVRATPTPPGISLDATLSGLHTTFVIEAEPDQLLLGLAWLTAQLREPDLVMTQRVVHVEKDKDSRAPLPLLGQLARRAIGAQGYGMLGFRQYGLDPFDPATAVWFSAQVFTTGNIALCFDGRIPDGVEVDLPVDERWSPPDRTTTGRHRPAVVETDLPEVGVFGVVKAGPVADVFGHTLAVRTTMRIHQQRPRFAPARPVVERIDVGRSAVLVSLDDLQSGVGFLVGSLQAALRDVVATGAWPHELHSYVTGVNRRVSNPMLHFDELRKAALRDLLGLRPLTPADELAEARAVTSPQVAAMADEFRDRLLFGVPEGTPAEYRFGMPLDTPRLTRVRNDGGTVFPSAYHERPYESVRLYPDMLAFVDGDLAVEVPLDSIVQAVMWPDGGHLLATSDGLTHMVEPNLWQRGEELVAALTSMLPARMYVLQPPRADIPPVPPPPEHVPAWKSMLTKVVAAAPRPSLESLPIPLGALKPAPPVPTERLRVSSAPAATPRRSA